jgi:lysophospholipase L1-like esterase
MLAIRRIPVALIVPGKYYRIPVGHLTHYLLRQINSSAGRVKAHSVEESSMGKKTPLRFCAALVLAGAGVLLPLAEAQNRTGSTAGEHWVTTWATAQPLAPASPMAGPGRSGPGAPGPKVQALAAAPPNGSPQGGRNGAPGGPGRGPGGRGGRGPAPLPTSFTDQSVRMILRSSIGGRLVRIELSNMTTASPLQIGAAHIAVYKGNGATVAGTDRALTFGGNEGVTIAAGVLVVSDPVDLEVAPLTELAVSVYLPHETSAASNHRLGLHTMYITGGNTTAAESLPESTKMTAYMWLSSVDVLAPANAFAVVALGDSITDSQGSSVDSNRAWPAGLARRLGTNKATRHIGVVNQGIQGNQVLKDGAGVSALARFERDVLSRPGVKWVILLEGVNDINVQGANGGAGALTADDLIWGYRQIIERAHMAGLKVMGATVMPEEGVWIANQRTEEIRESVNRWIRTKGNFDAVVDFDAVVRDSQHPGKLRPEFNSGDNIHLSDDGYQALADAFDLSAFK